VILVDMYMMKSKRQLLVQRRGAMLALTAIARDAAANLREQLPSFWDATFGPVTAVSSMLNFLNFCTYYFASETV